MEVTMSDKNSQSFDPTSGDVVVRADELTGVPNETPEYIGDYPHFGHMGSGRDNSLEPVTLGIGA